MNHVGTKTLETGRLILRRYTVEDAQQMYDNWASSEVVTEYLSWPPHASVDVTRALLEDWVAKYEEPSTYNWGIELKETGELVGNIAAVRQNEKIFCAEIGWAIGDRWWGQGIMPEAAHAVFGYLFKEAGFQRIEAKHDIKNPKSGRVMQKIGMVYEGTLRRGGCNNSGIDDRAIYSMLPEEYK
ncbi:MAG: GNAT family N-acetyltransferase [Clostridiales bacterium]|nr:GNAT family N-acetyltransferase [Candidatus Blautia equi]